MFLHLADIDYCQNKPCKNNSTCHSLSVDYSCDCLVGFTGKSCEGLSRCFFNAIFSSKREDKMSSVVYLSTTFVLKHKEEFLIYCLHQTRLKAKLRSQDLQLYLIIRIPYANRCSGNDFICLDLMRYYKKMSLRRLVYF